MLSLFRKKTEFPAAGKALPGRVEPISTSERHVVNGHRLKGPYPEGMKLATFGMGCFWGVERLFWQQQGVWVTAAGYAGGLTPNPTYEEVCSGMTGHNEVVRIVFDPALVSYRQLLKVFWEGHDPTQGMRQGNDFGTQYRSGIYAHDAESKSEAENSRDVYGGLIARSGLGPLTTEIVDAPPFYFAEDYHQQYLARNPHGYCGLRGVGVACPAE
ncbi:MAG: peptide-methionine (S)-S-oxide reductase MsrA [Rhodobacteraceae bacterium]|nr:peptide-methionine (S)-S-oxide reductase MsrA [Paracoccaceae bacterium]